jgi:hypothetical protein
VHSSHATVVMARHHDGRLPVASPSHAPFSNNALNPGATKSPLKHDSRYQLRVQALSSGVNGLLSRKAFGIIGPQEHRMCVGQLTQVCANVRRGCWLLHTSALSGMLGANSNSQCMFDQEGRYAAARPSVVFETGQTGDTRS